MKTHNSITQNQLEKNGKVQISLSKIISLHIISIKSQGCLCQVLGLYLWAGNNSLYVIKVYYPMM